MIVVLVILLILYLKASLTRPYLMIFKRCFLFGTRCR